MGLILILFVFYLATLFLTPYMDSVANHAFDRIDGHLISQAYLHLTKTWFKEQLKVP